MFGLSKNDERPRGKAKVVGSGKGGLTFGSSGLTPRNAHPGQEPTPHPHIAQKARRLEDHAAAFQHHYQNDVEANANAFRGGRRHVDPQHVDVSDEVKLEEGRLGRAIHPDGYQQTRGHLMVGSNAPCLSAPSNAAHCPPFDSSRPDPGTRSGRVVLKPSMVLHDNNTPRGGATSVQCSEAILRRMLKDSDPVYREAAQHALDQQRGEAEIVRTEKQISHHKAAKQFAEQSAARRLENEETKRQHQTELRRVKEEDSSEYGVEGSATQAARGRRPPPSAPASRSASAAGRFGEGGPHQLGKMSTTLAQSTPFALDNYPAEAGHTQGPPAAHNTSTQRPTKHYQTNFSSVQFAQFKSEQQREEEAQHARQLRAKAAPAYLSAPYDSTVSSPDGRYPAPPPVGVQQGLRDRHYLIQHSPQHNQSRLELDADTFNLQRAQALRVQHYGTPGSRTTTTVVADDSHGSTQQGPYASAGNTVICGSAMVGCYENNSDYNQRYNPGASTPRKLTSTTAGRMEARCHAREEVEAQKRTGRGHSYHQYKKTALW